MINGFRRRSLFSASKGNYGLRLFESHFRRKPDGASGFRKALTRIGCGGLQCTEAASLILPFRYSLAA